MNWTKNAASQSRIVRQDMKESGRCHRDGCSKKANVRIREDGTIVPICEHCAVKTLGVSWKVFDSTANIRAQGESV